MKIKFLTSSTVRASENFPAKMAGPKGRLSSPEFRAPTHTHPPTSNNYTRGRGYVFEIISSKLLHFFPCIYTCVYIYIYTQHAPTSIRSNLSNVADDRSGRKLNSTIRWRSRRSRTRARRSASSRNYRLASANEKATPSGPSLGGGSSHPNYEKGWFLLFLLSYKAASRRRRVFAAGTRSGRGAEGVANWVANYLVFRCFRTVYQ